MKGIMQKRIKLLIIRTKRRKRSISRLRFLHVVYHWSKKADVLLLSLQVAYVDEEKVHSVSPKKLQTIPVEGFRQLA